MERFNKTIVVRGLIALTILMSGLALVPYVEKPTEPLNWQLFAGVYEANLATNYTTGQPGSVFTLTGSNYPPNSVAVIAVNGEDRGTVDVDGSGEFTVLLNTTGAPAGTYSVSATVDANASALVTIELATDEPLRVAEGDGTTVPINELRFLPLIHNN